MKTLFPLLMLLALFLHACGGDTKEMDMDQGGVEEEEGAELIGDGTPGSDNIRLTDFPESTDFPNASIDEWSYDGATFNYEVSNYEFGTQTPDADDIMCANSDQGQHLHLIIDNEPYIAKYDPTFEQDMSDGQHYILTFLSRSYHESIKTPAAHRAVVANVMNGGFDDPRRDHRADAVLQPPQGHLRRPAGNGAGDARFLPRERRDRRRIPGERLTSMAKNS